MGMKQGDQKTKKGTKKVILPGFETAEDHD